MLRVIFLLLWSCYVPLHAQRPKPAIVSLNDLKATYHPTDSLADAYVMYDFGSAYIRKQDDGSYKAFHKRFTRIKILRKSAYEHANVEILQYRKGLHNEEWVSDIKGRTYWQESGQLRSEELNKTAVFESKKEENVFRSTFTLPHVQEGCIIEYEYELASDFVFQIPDWTFQQAIPVQWSEYYAMFPSNLGYRALFQNPAPLKIKRIEEDATNGTLLHYAVENLPALRPEPYTTTIKNYQSRLRFELAEALVNGQLKKFTRTWSDVDRSIITDETISKYLRNTNFLKDLATEIVSKFPDTLSRVKEAQAQIRQRMHWDGTVWYRSEASPRAVFDRKTGHSGEINLLLIGLLREMDLKAYPVLLSTRSHGFIFQENPMITYFNDLVGVVEVGGNQLLLDATDPYLPVGMLSERCLNNVGRLVDLRKPQWITLKPVSSREIRALDLTIDTDRKVHGNLTCNWTGTKAVEFRRKIQTQGKKVLDPVIQDGMEILDSKTENTEDVYKPLTYTTKISYQDAVSMMGDQLYVSPGFGQAMTNNPFKQAERYYPVDFGSPFEQTFMCTIKIPKGYTAETLPANLILTLPDNAGKYMYQIHTTEADSFTIVSRLQIRNTSFSSAEYPFLKKIFDHMIAKHTEPLVFRKK